MKIKLYMQFVGFFDLKTYYPWFDFFELDCNMFFEIVIKIKKFILEKNKYFWRKINMRKEMKEHIVKGIMIYLFALTGTFLFCLMILILSKLS